MTLRTSTSAARLGDMGMAPSSPSLGTPWPFKFDLGDLTQRTLPPVVQGLHLCEDRISLSAGIVRGSGSTLTHPSKGSESTWVVL